MASKPVESQTCNPQSCVDCRMDGKHWFTGINKWDSNCCSCGLRWGEWVYYSQNPCGGSGHCAYFCYSGIYTSNGYIYTRNTSVNKPYGFGICRRPA